MGFIRRLAANSVRLFLPETFPKQKTILPQEDGFFLLSLTSYFPPLPKGGWREAPGGYANCHFRPHLPQKRNVTGHTAPANTTIKP